MAVEEINAAGGVLGKDIRARRSGRRDRRGGREHRRGHVARRRRRLHVGPAGSSVALGVLDKITGAGIPMCSPSNTGTQFTTVDDNDGFYFRTAPDNLQAQVLADPHRVGRPPERGRGPQSTEYGEGRERPGRGGSTHSTPAPDPILYDAEAGEAPGRGGADRR